MPQTLYHAIVVAHAATGTIALLSFWSAAAMRKGGDAHRFAGRVFLLAMCAIGATALPMAATQFARGNPVGGIFLTYLLVITASACARAWFAVRLKREPARYFGRWYRVAAFGNLALGAAVMALGLQHHAIVLSGFSIVGLALGAQMVRMARRAPPPRWAVVEHYRGMLGAGVATHVAFLGIGLTRLLPAYAGTAQMLMWFAPLLVSLIAGAYLKRRYGSARAAILPNRGVAPP
ncbi:MAG TPA: hypothetical protein VFM56_05065 [Solimonas sp.]|nr:hypothetical protein [Solimonas sp.]